MRKKVRFFISILFGVVLLINMTGCASITKGTSQSITINTEPTGAVCTLSREGIDIAVVNPTPGSVTVDKDKDTITVLCKKDKYQNSAEALSSKVHGMTFGNILLGGVIGLAIDAGSGAMHHYQPMLTLIMVPSEFNSLSAKDEYFENMKSDYIERYSQNMTRINNKCNAIREEDTNAKSNCEKQLELAEVTKEENLTEIEKKRDSTKIVF